MGLWKLALLDGQGRDLQVTLTAMVMCSHHLNRPNAKSHFTVVNCFQGEARTTGLDLCFVVLTGFS